ncbi:MAG: 1,4-dihydroxy-6-naphthoate synthase [Desulfobacteraceae bacterium Eth-SRB1]|nr:MAG: 1,4-dihydroxy-6-naphthoate synthase [Desulfobacteraceae bacterium Eth-SRB1]
MNTNLKLGYSTCPNDTFIFYALAHNLVDCGGLTFNIELADIETLNQRAGDGILDISKLSFAAIGHLLDTYGVLRSGSAIGRGCGPIVVARKGCNLDGLDSKKIAVPGMWTTACMLLGLYLGAKPVAIPIPFDRIMPAVARGDFDFGVVIHEGRFTFREHGLVGLLDLGKWWEQKTSLPVPLGGIVIRRDIACDITKKVETAIRQSVEYASNHRVETGPYIKKYAMEMAPDVIRRHIDLYVNEFTINTGREGEEAIEALFSMARDRKILPESELPVFVC